MGLSRLASMFTVLILAAAMAATARAAEQPGDDSAGPTDVDNYASPVIATGDFNRDGIADLVEATSPDETNSGEHFLRILLGRPDGTFTAGFSQRLIHGDARAMVVGDFNGDGNPDVIVGDSNGTLREFVGDGKGDLVDAGSVATVGSVASIGIGHFTHSGHLDLVVSDFRSNSAVILLGSNNGAFRVAWSFQLPRVGREFHIATADFNQDGIDDLVIGNDDDDDYEVMLGNGNGTFTYAPELSHLRDPKSYCPS
ncbi:MAG TPA: VCBS repeat-containing protein [Terracidiphilus sp.]|nr:VCBS repeat-containing protein [Terracidiphilus sp.]